MLLSIARNRLYSSLNVRRTLMAARWPKSRPISLQIVITCVYGNEFKVFEQWNTYPFFYRHRKTRLTFLSTIWLNQTEIDRIFCLISSLQILQLLSRHPYVIQTFTQNFCMMAYVWLWYHDNQLKFTFRKHFKFCR